MTDCLDIVCCPACRSDLSRDGPERLRCSRCERSYPVTDGIPVLFADESDHVSTIVREFYSGAWKPDDAGVMQGRVEGEDLSDLGRRYVSLNEDRFRELFQSLRPARWFLDAGSGALPRVGLGSRFERHVCLDMSLVGLHQARRTLGKRGVFVCGSLLRAPLRDAVFDAALAAHCVYHIDRDLQAQAVSELSRVVRPSGKILILYGNPRSLERHLARVVKLVRSRWRGRGGASRAEGKGTSIYYFSHPIGRFASLLRERNPGARIAVLPLRLVGRHISAPLFRLPRLGRSMLAVLRLLERVLAWAPAVFSYVAYAVERPPQAVEPEAAPGRGAVPSSSTT